GSESDSRFAVSSAPEQAGGRRDACPTLGPDRLCLAERGGDGSRGFEPTVGGRTIASRRGATVEWHYRSRKFTRRSATHNRLPVRNPWAEAHGYRRYVAPRRGSRIFRAAPVLERRRDPSAVFPTERQRARQRLECG